MRTVGRLFRSMAGGLLAAVALCSPAGATESENFNMQVLPAPDKVVVDGKFDDWDLTAGILACSDAENLRDKYSQWFHVMYDAKNLYLLARWKDPTPLNNPGVKGDFGATHGDKSGKDTILRSHWNNQATGLVNDEVFELRMEPANWGEFTFEP